MTTTTSATSRPTCTPNKSTTTITCRATGPLMGLIDRLIKANDKPKAEILLEIQILEVDRIRMKQLGLDLTQYALGFTFSPEVAPPNTPGSFPPVSPPPFNLNTISGGIGPNDYYVTVPTALVRAMESDNKTRTLAKPSVRGAEGVDITMNLGDQIPMLNSTIPSVTTGLGTTAPVTNHLPSDRRQPQRQAQVTFDDEIILDLTVDNSGVGAEMNVGGTIVAVVHRPHGAREAPAARRRNRTCSPACCVRTRRRPTPVSRASCVFRSSGTCSATSRKRIRATSSSS